MVTPVEFAHTMRSMRPSYEVTVKDARQRLSAALLRGKFKAAKRYRGALKALLADPETFR